MRPTSANEAVMRIELVRGSPHTRTDPTRGIMHVEFKTDLAIVLHPRFWGLGYTLAREILRRAFAEMDHDSVIVLLPPSRTRVRALKRMGFEEDGQVVLGGELFIRYRGRNPRRPETRDSDPTSDGGVGEPGRPKRVTWVGLRDAGPRNEGAGLGGS